MGAQETRTDSLSGLWTGRYWYMSSNQHIPATVPFSAVILDSDGIVTGTTLEPNSFANNNLSELTATIDGQQQDGMIDFMKIYDLLPDVHQYPIDYTGDIDEDWTRIVGGWCITLEDWHEHGGFELVRVTKSVEITRAVTIEL